MHSRAGMTAAITCAPLCLQLNALAKPKQR
jgi:hypothetical protein